MSNVKRGEAKEGKCGEKSKDVNNKTEYDDYFEMVQSRKKLSPSLQEKLTAAFTRIPVSSFPLVPRGKVIEIQADTTIADAVKILSESNIVSAPVRNPDAGDSMDWKERYLGILDYSTIVLWVLETADLAAAALTATSATAAGIGAGAASTLGAIALGATGPVAAAGLAVAAIGAAVAGGVAAEKGMGKDAPTAADELGEDFYKVILQEEPFKSTQVKSIVKSYRWAPYIPVSTDSSMLSVLLLLSKYRLRNVPVIEHGQPLIKNFITQSAVVQGLEECKGRDWFDSISVHPITELGLPFVSKDKVEIVTSTFSSGFLLDLKFCTLKFTRGQVISSQSDELVLEAFKKMKDNQIGGLPVVEGPTKKIVGNVSIKDIKFLLLKQKLFTNFRKLTVKDFMNTIATTSEENMKIISPITCKLGSTLGEVISTLSSKCVHRIYVVNDGNDVIGIITLRDVISCFINEPPNYMMEVHGSALKEMLSKDKSRN